MQGSDGRGLLAFGLIMSHYVQTIEQTGNIWKFLKAFGLLIMLAGEVGVHVVL